MEKQKRRRCAFERYQIEFVRSELKQAANNGQFAQCVRRLIDRVKTGNLLTKIKGTDRHKIRHTGIAVKTVIKLANEVAKEHPGLPVYKERDFNDLW